MNLVNGLIFACTLALSLVVVSVGQDLSQTQSHNFPVDLQQVTLGNVEDCGQFVDMKAQKKYSLTMNLTSSISICGTVPSSDGPMGFECQITFNYEDVFSRTGNRLCVDVQGIPSSFGNRTQLRLVVGDNLKTVNSSSLLKPKSEPYYVCASPTSKIISLSLLVRKSVPMCRTGLYGAPSITQTLVGNPVRMGTVTLREDVPSYDLLEEHCGQSYLIHGDHYFIKFDQSRFSLKQCQGNVTHALGYSKSQGCLQLQYLSQNYGCDVSISLGQKIGNWIRFTVPQGGRLRYPSLPLCGTFFHTEGDVLLTIKKNGSPCDGQFVIGVNFTEVEDGDNDKKDDGKDDLRHLYMAVFITLIAVCLLILGLTCVCCLRMRNKRARQAARRLRSRTSANASDNEGFQTTVPYDPSLSAVFWNPDNPGQVFGLPTYEEVIGQNSGVNPSSDGNKDDLPPTYESLYVSDS
ncbi:uncharacterized protein LOC101850582 [Aplysia californica]|uniref:Uncharacterized protein LOC101850582 n=1 Tax=Aplysia californica TaxID=6500 RepID=A0ABM0JX69_APLCA|nr:uncharacterized protein LOC101850582 [Aplysia californica]